MIDYTNSGPKWKSVILDFQKTGTKYPSTYKDECIRWTYYNVGFPSLWPFYAESCVLPKVDFLRNYV